MSVRTCCVDDESRSKATEATDGMLPHEDSKLSFEGFTESMFCQEANLTRFHQFLAAEASKKHHQLDPVKKDGKYVNDNPYL